MCGEAMSGKRTTGTHGRTMEARQTGHRSLVTGGTSGRGRIGTAGERIKTKSSSVALFVRTMTRRTPALTPCSPPLLGQYADRAAQERRPARRLRGPLCPWERRSNRSSRRFWIWTMLSLT